MAFLSLSKCDPASRNMLQAAIRARYGLRPVAIESVRLTLEGQGEKVLGLFPLTQEVTLLLKGTRERKWDSTSKLWGISMKQETIDLTQDSPDNPDNTLLRHLAWAEMAFFLTPLTAEGVTLNATGENEFETFQDSTPEIKARVKLTSDDTISVQTQYVGQSITLFGQGALQTLDGFTVPRQIIYWWSNRQEIFTITQADTNPTG